MKLVTAVVKPDKLDDVVRTVADNGPGGLTISEMMGFGQQYGHHVTAPLDDQSALVLPKIRADVLVQDELAEAMTSAIAKAAATGSIGGGKIWGGGFNGIAIQISLAEKFYWDYAREIPLVLKLNGKTDIPAIDPLSPLDATVEDAVRLGADVVCTALYVGSPAQEHDFAQLLPVRDDALVVGSRGHGGFAEELLGSVAQHCMHHSTCPVVVIRDSVAGSS